MLVALVIAASERLARVICGLGGHTLAFHFEPNRMSLYCLSCGHTTPGWTIRAHVTTPPPACSMPIAGFARL